MKKNFLTKLVFKFNKIPTVEPEAIKKNYKIIQEIMTRILLEFKDEIDIKKMSLNLIDSVEDNAFLVKLEILTPLSTNLDKLSELRIQIKEFMVRRNYYKYISIVDESDSDYFSRDSDEGKALNG